MSVSFYIYFYFPINMSLNEKTAEIGLKELANSNNSISSTGTARRDCTCS